MNVLIIGSFDLLMHPYAKKYIDAFKKEGCNIVFIYWNRSGDTIENDPSLHPFNYPLNTYKSKLSKLKGYFKYRKFVKAYFKNNTVDRVVFLTTQTMVFFAKYAIKKYDKKYIFDYRDETYEKYGFYKKIVEKCIRHSYKTVVSSEAFCSIFDKIDKNHFLLSHNVKEWIKHSSIIKQESEIIRLSFWGQVRQIDYFKRIISCFANDPKYKIFIYGEGYGKELLNFINSFNITNVSISGRFEPHQIFEFAKTTDVLINCYSNNSIQKRALTVKMYEGVYFNIPMIVQKGSYMSDYLKNNDVSFIEADFDNPLNYDKNMFLNSYYSLEKNDYQRIKETIDSDETRYYSCLRAFCKETIDNE